MARGIRLVPCSAPCRALQGVRSKPSAFEVWEVSLARLDCWPAALRVPRASAVEHERAALSGS
eukprot:COSAG02_NODE_1458_length_12476_cov_6.772841_6_plen_63_part_00